MEIKISIIEEKFLQVATCNNLQYKFYNIQYIK